MGGRATALQPAVPSCVSQAPCAEGARQDVSPPRPPPPPAGAAPAPLPSPPGGCKAPGGPATKPRRLVPAGFAPIPLGEPPPRSPSHGEGVGQGLREPEVDPGGELRRFGAASGQGAARARPVWGCKRGGSGFADTSGRGFGVTRLRLCPAWGARRRSGSPSPSPDGPAAPGGAAGCEPGPAPLAGLRLPPAGRGQQHQAAGSNFVPGLEKGTNALGLRDRPAARPAAVLLAPPLQPGGGGQRGRLAAPRCSALVCLPLLPPSSSCWCCSFLPHSSSKRLEETVRNRGSTRRLAAATAWLLRTAPAPLHLCNSPPAAGLTGVEEAGHRERKAGAWELQLGSARKPSRIKEEEVKLLVPPKPEVPARPHFAGDIRSSAQEKARACNQGVLVALGSGRVTRVDSFPSYPLCPFY